MLETIFSFLKTIFDIKKTSVELKNFFLFLKKNKIINLPIILSFLFLILCSYEFVSYLYKDTIYLRSIKNIKIITTIDDVLKNCGDKTSITVSTVSISQNEDGKYNGSFEHARACDFENNKSGCIVNLIDFNDLYKKIQKIDLSTYLYLVGLGQNTTPSYFYLRNDKDEQNLESASDYPMIIKLLSSTNWYRENSLNSLWVTSVVNFNKKVIYVLTLTSAKPVNKNSCMNQGDSLLEIKNYLRNNND